MVVVYVYLIVDGLMSCASNHRGEQENVRPRLSRQVSKRGRGRMLLRM